MCGFGDKVSYMGKAAIFAIGAFLRQLAPLGSKTNHTSSLHQARHYRYRDRPRSSSRVRRCATVVWKLYSLILWWHFLDFSSTSLPRSHLDRTLADSLSTSCIDPTFFVLQVDLWDETGLHEKNVVRAANNSPATSISTATTTSYPPPPDRIYTAPSQQMAPVYHSYGGQMMVQAQPQNPCAPQMYQQPQGLPPMYGQNPQGGYYPPPQMQQSGYPQSYGGPPPGGAPMGYQSYPSAVMPSSQPQTGMFTRNLIGSLTVNAFTLKDPKNNEGHWFILQDLSVRTEGTFRYVDLRCTHASK